MEYSILMLRFVCCAVVRVVWWLWSDDKKLWMCACPYQCEYWMFTNTHTRADVQMWLDGGVDVSECVWYKGWDTDNQLIMFDSTPSECADRHRHRKNNVKRKRVRILALSQRTTDQWNFRVYHVHL